MYRNKSILAIVPARSGSTRIPDKNMQEINGTSLIGLAGLCLKEWGGCDRVVMSSNVQICLDEGIKYGMDMHKRPDILSTGFPGSITHVINHVLTQLDQKYDIILLIEPSSPMRNVQDIRDCVGAVIDHDVDCAFTVSPMPYKFRPWRVLKASYMTDPNYPYVDVRPYLSAYLNMWRCAY